MVDGLRTQRLDQPVARVNGRLQPATWKDAFATHLRQGEGSVGKARRRARRPLAAVEDMFALKSLMGALGSANIDARYPGSPLPPQHGRASYLFNSTIAGIDQADAIMLIGTNPRREAAVSQRPHPQALPQGQRALGLLGEKVDLTLSL